MPKITGDGSSNAREELEQFPGTSFSTFVSRPDRSGISTGTDLQSPVPDAESPSEPDPPASQISSSASLTDGSTQGTGSGLPSLPVSSEESAPATPATPAPASKNRRVR